MDNSPPFNPYMKGATRHCSFGGCTSDSRYQNTTRRGITFIPFAKPCLRVRKKEIEANEDHLKSCDSCEKCKRWISLCQRKDKRLVTLCDVTKNLYLCSLHFVRGHGFSDRFPDPLPTNTVIEIRESLGKRRINALLTNMGKKQKLYTGVATETLKTEGIEDDPLQVNVSQIGTENSESSNFRNLLNNRLPPISKIQRLATGSTHRSTQTTFTWKDVSKLQEENRLLKLEVISLKKKLLQQGERRNKKNVTQFAESLKNNQRKCKYSYKKEHAINNDE